MEPLHRVQFHSTVPVQNISRVSRKHTFPLLDFIHALDMGSADAWNEAHLLRGFALIPTIAHHGIGFPGTCLSICKDGRVVAVEAVVQ